MDDYLSEKFLNDAGFNSGFNTKDKVMMKISIILSLMLIVASDAQVNLDNPESWQIYPMRLDRSMRLISSF